MQVRMLVRTASGDSRNIYFEIDGEYSDEKVDEAVDSLTIGDLLVDRDDQGRVTWAVPWNKVESRRFFYEDNDGFDW